MAIKKSQLYSTLWKSCDELRGSMDASQYKDYVLVILFLKYISDKKKADPDYIIDIPEGSSFDDLVRLKGNKDIGEKINEALDALTEANGMDRFEADFNDEQKLGKGKDKVDTLSNLIGVFQDAGLNFSNNRANDDDLIGDAYEYLMKNFATESGKSKGQFYTPSEVSRLMAKLLDLSKVTDSRTTINDPTCGSGSLLLRAQAETNSPEGVSIFGQEKDNATVGLCKMNMILHGVVDADIRQGDTLRSPRFREGNELDTYDYVVANPPFSLSSWMGSGQQNDIYGRWSVDTTGVPPESVGDYAFLLHIIKTLNPTGQGAVILPHGVLFRGGAEATIRRYIVGTKHYIKGIIGLPPNLFYGTGIPACILILDKKDAENRRGIFFIDAKDGFIKDGNKNRLREQDIRRIVDVWNAHQDVPHYARFVSNEEIANEKNDYNLNIPRYITAEDKEITQDISAHLKGGLPPHDIEQMHRYWEVCPTLRDALFEPSQRQDYYQLRCQPDEIRQTVEENDSFLKQHAAFLHSFKSWTDREHDLFYGLHPGVTPKRLIARLGSDLLEIFKKDASLVDAYNVYDQLMNYWYETMQDDFYLIDSDGWKATLYVPQPEQKKKTGKQTKAKVATSIDDLACDLLPVSIVVNEYFADDLSAIEQKEEEKSSLEDELNSLVEDNEQYFDEERFADKKINKQTINKRIKTLPADGDEAKVLHQWGSLKDKIAEVNKKIKELNIALLDETRKKYDTLTEDDIRRLVIEKKWIASLSQRLNEEMQRISQQITTDVTALHDRYAETLPEIDAEIEELEKKVEASLKEMGY